MKVYMPPFSSTPNSTPPVLDTFQLRVLGAVLCSRTDCSGTIAQALLYGVILKQLAALHDHVWHFGQ